MFQKDNEKKASQLSYLPFKQSNGVQHDDSESSSILFGLAGAAKLVGSSDVENQRILRSHMN